MLLIEKFDTSEVEKRIEELELEYKFRFPEQYRKFLLKYNGGRTPKTEFKVKPRRKENVHAFFGYDTKGKHYDLCKFPAFVDEWVEAGFIPIAEDGLGQDYLIGINQENYGEIWLADHDEREIELVRNSFQEFIQSCHSGKINPMVLWPIEKREAMMIEEGNGHLITDSLRAMWQDEIDRYSNMVREEVVLD